MTAVRRSGRARSKPTSIYEDAKKDIVEDVSPKSRRKRNNDDMSEDERDTDSEAPPQDDDDEEEEEPHSDDEEDASEDEADDFQPKKKRKAPAASSTVARVTPKKKKKTTNKTNNTNSKTNKTTVPRRRGVASLLTTLSKKVLFPEETPETSLVAGLLSSYETKKSNKNGSSPYTKKLHALAHQVVQQEQQDPNQAHIALLNLLFRSVGGSLDTNLDPSEIQLEEMDSDAWTHVINQLVDEMSFTKADCVLLCADPFGAVHAAAVDHIDVDSVQVSPSAGGVVEYRKIYKEFWKILATVALSHNTSKGDNHRFGIEVVKDLLARVTELVVVGQPDIRAAATLAALQMGHAVLDRTIQLMQKLQVATRQFKAAEKNKSASNSKKDSLKHQMESLQRTTSDLEELVCGNLIQGVFMHRYRDSNPYTRAACLESLSQMTLQRPDLFLNDKYLKYFGWMMSDKSSVVRRTSLAGLHAPFLHTEKAQVKALQIDTSAMEHVSKKFLPRIVDCAIDTSQKVQEEALPLILALTRHGLLDDVEDDTIWSQINSRALAKDTTPSVRKHALYFVMEQLDPFDDSNEAEQDASGRDNLLLNRLDCLANWVAHSLCDGPIPDEDIRIEYADYIVESLRNMPEHKQILKNWSGMLSLIAKDDPTSMSPNAKEDRAAVAKQRVLVRIIASAAEAEVGTLAESDFCSAEVDPDVRLLESDLSAGAASQKKKRASSYSPGMAHEELSVSLLKALPDLLVKFKSDPVLLESITNLPRYLLPSIISLPQRKKDFTSLVKNLADIYLESADPVVLRNIALSLSVLSSGDHARASDARRHLQRIASSLCDRLLDLLEKSASTDSDGNIKKRKRASSQRSSRGRSSTSSQSFSSTAGTDAADDSDVTGVQFTISLCLKRLLQLAKKQSLAELLDGSSERGSDGDSDTRVETLCNAIMKEVARQLSLRKINVEDDTGVLPDVWTSVDRRVHMALADSVKDALSLIVALIGWEVKQAQEEPGVFPSSEDEMVSDEVEDVEDHLILRLRDGLVRLLELCFDQHSTDVKFEEDTSMVEPQENQTDFAKVVEAHAGKAAADLRTLLPREWTHVASPVLQAAALTNDVNLMGGYTRYFSSEVERLRTNDKHDKSHTILANDLLYALCRPVAANWKYGNRREAGVALSHITGCGEDATKIVSSMSQLLKKIDPVRLLEAHMASLRQSYEAWVNNEPEEIESDHPTDEEMAEFAEAEKQHEFQFVSMLMQASRLSQSLGVGKLSEPELNPSLLGFVREGLRYAFSYDEDDTLLCGSRLPFLIILAKYANWIRKDKDHQEVIHQDLGDREIELRENPDFDEVHEDDLAAIGAFREAIGGKKTERNVSATADANSVVTDYDEDASHGEHMTPSPSDHSSKRPRMSRGSSVGSVRSRLSSTQNSLSPLYEEDGTIDSSEEDEPSPSPAKRRKVRRGHSIGSSMTQSTVGKMNMTIEEESGESDSD